MEQQPTEQQVPQQEPQPQPQPQQPQQQQAPQQEQVPVPPPEQPQGQAGGAEPPGKRHKGPGGEDPSTKGAGKARSKSSGDPQEEGEIRFRSPDSVVQAVRLLDNSTLLGYQMKVVADPLSEDGTKIIVTGMPPGIGWQELKDHFQQVGEVQFASIGRSTHDPRTGFGFAIAGNPCMGEVRFASADDAQRALQAFQGQPFKDTTLQLKPDLSSWHGTKLLIFNVPVGTHFSELKELFQQVGPIEFCGIDCAGKGKGGGKGCKGGGGSGPGGFDVPGGQLEDGGCTGDQPLVGEVRFENPQHAEQALSVLNGSQMNGTAITVVQDGGCANGSRVLCFNLPPGVTRQALKDHFEQVGAVAFCGWKGQGKGVGGKGFGKYDGQGCHGYFGESEPFGNPAKMLGEVRFATAAEAAESVELFHGSQLGNSVISVAHDQGCRDGTRVLVFNLPTGMQRQAFQEYFEQIGTVVFCGWKGKGKGCMKGDGYGMQGSDWDGGMSQGLNGQGVEYGGGCSGAGGGCASGAGCGAGAGAGGPLIGEVRYENQQMAEQALMYLNGSTLGGSTVQVVQDAGSKDGTRVLVFGLQPGTPWQMLKEHFGQAGIVAFAGYRNSGGGRVQPGGHGMGGCLPQGGWSGMQQLGPEQQYQQQQLQQLAQQQQHHHHHQPQHHTPQHVLPPPPRPASVSQVQQSMDLLHQLQQQHQQQQAQQHQPVVVAAVPSALPMEPDGHTPQHVLPPSWTAEQQQSWVQQQQLQQQQWAAQQQWAGQQQQQQQHHWSGAGQQMAGVAAYGYAMGVAQQAGYPGWAVS